MRPGGLRVGDPGDGGRVERATDGGSVRAGDAPGAVFRWARSLPASSARLRSQVRRALGRSRGTSVEIGGGSAFGADLEVGEREWTEGGDERDVDRVATAADDHTSDAGAIVACVEGVPAAVEIGLEPCCKIHLLRGLGNTDLGDVAEHIAGGDVQGTAERDRQVCEVTAYTLAGAVGVGGCGPRVG